MFFLKRLSLIGIIFVFGCSGTNNLNGIWDDEGWFSIEFSGKDYVVKIHNHVTEKGTFSIKNNNIEFSPLSGDKHSAVFSRSGNTITIGDEQFTRQGKQQGENSSSNPDDLGGSWGLFEGDFRRLYQSFGYPFNEITFSGRNYTTNSSRFNGRYSISGNEIELIDVSGNILVLSFSRTQNTINIDGARFRRK